MIAFEGVTKYYRAGAGRKVILDDASFLFAPGANYGILGGNGSGKSTLLRLISGAEHPTRGTIRLRARVSFPLGFSGTFHGHLSGRQNATFLARLYGADEGRAARFVADFAELGPYFDMPVQTYSSGMMAKLAFGVSFAIDFDVYLVDEATEVGDVRFRQKCGAAFRERATRSDIIMVSHNSQTIRAICTRAAVLANGSLRFYDTVDEAMQAHKRIMGSVHA